MEISENLKYFYTQTSKPFFLQSAMKKSLKKHFQVEMVDGLQMQWTKIKFYQEGRICIILIMIRLAWNKWDYEYY